MDVPWLREIERDLVGADRITDVSVLVGGEVNEALKVRCASGTTLVVRRAPAEVADWHPTIAGQLAAIDRARAAGVPVPEVTYAAGRVLAYRHIEGAALDANVTPLLARQAGRVHGALHAVRGEGVGPVQADGTSAGWPLDVAFADVSTWVRRLLAAPTPLRDADVRAAAALLGDPIPPSPARLLHGDASPANTVVRDGQIVALIDFDDAWYGDPAADAAWWWWNSPETGDDFVAGCEEAGEPIDAAIVWIYRIRLLLGLADTFATTNRARGERIAALLHEAVLATGQTS